MQKRKPIILINCKTYKEATGTNAVKFAKICQKIQKKNKHVEIILAVQASDIYAVKKSCSLQIYAQHIDPPLDGPHTGAVTAKAIKAAGASGTILNHAEKPMRIDDIECAIAATKIERIKSVVCAADPIIGSILSLLKPDFIAVEPPELIGGNISIAEADPELIRKAVDKITGFYPQEKVLIGAGIKTRKDVETALNLGAQGVLVSSHIVKAKNQKTALITLIPLKRR